MDKYKEELAEACNKGRAASEVKKPRLRQITTSDATPEAVPDIIDEDNPQAILVDRDEGSCFYDKKYNAGNRDLIKEGFNGQWLEINRKHGEEKYKSIPVVSVSLITGIQPDVLWDFVGENNDGFASRFLFAWGEQLPPNLDKKYSSADIQVIDDAFFSLYHDIKENTKIMIANGCKDQIQAWLTADYDRRKQKCEIEKLWSKKEELLLRIAGNLACSDSEGKVPSDYIMIKKEHVERAIYLMDDVFLPHLLASFGSVKNKRYNDTARVFHYIRDNRLERFHLADHRNKRLFRDLQAQDKLDAILKTFEEKNVLKQISKYPPKRGAPPKAYWVNSQIYQDNMNSYDTEKRDGIKRYG
jgi:hypothetical protein